MQELRNMAWVEKYRPNTTRKVISEHTEKILKYLEQPKSLPNFLFYSKTGGTGKTSIAKSIIKDLQCDYISLNASADRSIEGIRSTVKSFISGQSSNGMRRCVMMDEAEKLTKDAMDALKNIIEEYSSNAFFIFTTNSIEKINQPIQSRFICLEFSNINKEKIKEHLIYICKNEELEYDEKGVEKVISLYYPSIRNMISILQDTKVQGKKVTELSIVNPDDKYVELFEMIKNKQYTALKTKIIEDDVDVEYFNKWIFQYCLKGNVALKQELLLIQCCSRNVKAFSTGADKLIVFLSEAISMIQCFKE